MMQYIRLAKGLSNQTSELVPVTENIAKLIKKNPKIDQYVSLYRYEDRHYEQFKKTNSVAGIKDVTTPKLLFDFDDSQNIENARRDAIQLCGRLVEKGVPENKIRVYFSGNKGFHVELFTDQSFARQEFYNIVANLAGDLKSFDHRINDEARIVRAPFTKHPKTGLHKIPLTISDLTSWHMEQISSNAIEDVVGEYDQDLFRDENYKITPPPQILELKTKEYRKVTSSDLVETLIFNTGDIDFSKCPKWMAKERYALQEGFFYGSESIDKGERNTAFMILGATYKNQGFSADHALSLLEATAERQAKRTGETPYTSDQLKREVINVVYNPTWKGGIYGKDEELLILTRQRFNISDVEINTDLVGIDNVGMDFREFARNIDRNTIKTGLKSLDERVLITSGMMVSLLAAPGAGKTSFANLFVESLSKQGENTIYFSLDMYKNLLFSRLLQRYSGYDMRKILGMFKEDKPDEILLDAYTNVLKNYSNAYFNFKSGPTVEEIEKEIVSYQIEKGKEVKLVVVDYLEKMRGPFSDSTANSAYVASRLSDIAKKYHTTVLLLVQPQKSAGDPREELTSYRKIKGASVIEQDSRVILTLSRPGYDPKDMTNDKFATISVVKNNMGGLCQLDFGWNGVSGEMNDLTIEERRELKDLRSRIAEAKADEFAPSTYTKKPKFDDI